MMVSTTREWSGCFMIMRSVRSVLILPAGHFAQQFSGKAADDDTAHRCSPEGVVNGQGHGYHWEEIGSGGPRRGLLWKEEITSQNLPPPTAFLEIRRVFWELYLGHHPYNLPPPPQKTTLQEQGSDMPVWWNHPLPTHHEDYTIQRMI